MNILSFKYFPGNTTTVRRARAIILCLAVWPAGCRICEGAGWCWTVSQMVSLIRFFWLESWTFYHGQGKLYPLKSESWTGLIYWHGVTLLVSSFGFPKACFQIILSLFTSPHLALRLQYQKKKNIPKAPSVSPFAFSIHRLLQTHWWIYHVQVTNVVNSDIA